ncbi:MAG: hypothetical protein H8E39_00450 [Alphaproteobacteria bacterium]|nr:hypothetical protein [Alphaproteobacteria bacterium]
MALKTIISRDKALERSLEHINRRLQDALLDDPSGNGPAAQNLRARRAALKAR